MNTPELERRLGVVLREHAEEAMNSTDTQAHLPTFPDRIEKAARRRRLGWGAGALAAAAAVVAVAVVAVTGADDDVPADTVAASGAPAAEDVASGFVTAYAAYDLDRAASYLADDATVLVWSSPQDVDGMRQEAAWSRAVGFRMLPGRCGAEPEDGSVVVCPFDFHALGSDEIGRGPFSSNELTVTVSDGEIVTAEVSLPYWSNGFSDQAWEPFARWVSRAHPKDAAVMYADWPGVSMQAMTDRANELWERNTRAYVVVVEEGGAR